MRAASAIQLQRLEDELKRAEKHAIGTLERLGVSGRQHPPTSIFDELLELQARGKLGAARFDRSWDAGVVLNAVWMFREKARPGGPLSSAELVEHTLLAMQLGRLAGGVYSAQREYRNSQRANATAARSIKLSKQRKALEGLAERFDALRRAHPDTKAYSRRRIATLLLPASKRTLANEVERIVGQLKRLKRK